MTQKLTESALMAALSFVLYVSGYVPFLSAFVLLASPLPITWVGTRHGGRQAALSALCAAVVVGLVIGPPDAYLYLVPFGLLGVVSGGLFHRDEEPVRMLVIGTTLLLIATAPAAMLLEKAMGLQDPIVELRKMVEGTLSAPVSWVVSDPATIKVAVACIQAQIGTMVKLPLAFFLATCLILFYANHMACFLLFWRLRAPVAPPPDLRAFTTPKWLTLALPLAVAGYLAAGGGNGRMVNSILLNLAMIAAFFLYVGGLSCLTTLLDHSRLKPLARVGVSFSALLLFPATILLGALDPFFGVRDVKSRTPTKPLGGFR